MDGYPSDRDARILAALASETETPPTPPELAAWFDSGDCPDDEAAESGRLGLALLESRVATGDPSLPTAGMKLARLEQSDTGLVAWFSLEFEATDCEPALRFTATETMQSLADTWNDLPEPKPRFPLTPIVEAWLRRPIPAEPNLRPDRVLPAKLAMVRPTDRRAGRLFSAAAHVSRQDGQQVMPGFGYDDPLSPAFPVSLYDLGVSNPDKAGGAAPLAFRLFVESVLSVPLSARDQDRATSVSVTLRELLAKLYPNAIPRPSRYWPRLNRAVEALDSFDARIPWFDAETGHGGLRRVVSVIDIPRGPDTLDDLVRLVVDLPPGSKVGPVVPATLGQWGLRSAPAYRGLLNLAYRWHDPGRTRYPVDGGRHWVQMQDPYRYDPVSEDELVRLMFPTSSHKTRRVQLKRARRTLAMLEQAGELRVVEDGKTLRILPPPGHST